MHNTLSHRVKTWAPGGTLFAVLLMHIHFYSTKKRCVCVWLRCYGTLVWALSIRLAGGEMTGGEHVYRIFGSLINTQSFDIIYSLV